MVKKLKRKISKKRNSLTENNNNSNQFKEKSVSLKSDEPIEPKLDFVVLFEDLKIEINNLCTLWLKYGGRISVLELLQLLKDYHDAKIGYGEFVFEQKLITFLNEKEIKNNE